MNMFNSVYHLAHIIESTNRRCSGLELFVNQNFDELQPVVLADREFSLTIPAFGTNPEINVKRVLYCRKYLTVFSCSKEYLGEEGKGTYGIGLFQEGTAPRWSCDSILFDETGAPLLIQGRKAALEVAVQEAQLCDKSKANENEKTILTHALMDAPVLNALLGTLIRAEPGTTPATIAVRSGKIELLLEDDEEGGRSLSVRKEKFVCRDDAAGMVLNEIEYAADEERRAQRTRIHQRFEPILRMTTA